MKKISKKDMGFIKALVGGVDEADLQYVDCYAAENFGLFIPSVGHCAYAITPQHTHPAYSFILFFSEEQSILPVSIEVAANCYLAAALSPEVPHEEKKEEVFTRYIALMISRKTFEDIYRDYHPEIPEIYRWKQFAVPQSLMNDLKVFMAEYENQLPGAEAYLNALGVTITHQIIRCLLSMSVHREHIGDKFEIERVIALMNQNYGEKTSISSLACLANMSESHFARVFKKETGDTPMDYLMKVRIEKSKKYLRSQTMSMTEIAMRCGFSNASHFSSSFSKHMNVSPTAYQKAFNSAGS